MMPTPAPADTVDPWSSLEAGCAAALGLSQDLLARLQSGAAAEELVPLLERERQAVDDLRAQIAALAVRPPGAATAAGAERRDGIAAQLQELLHVDTRSRELLSRRGVRLKPPRWRRGATRKGV